MTEYLNSVSIPVIVTVVYVIIDLIKTTIAPYAQASERLSHFYWRVGAVSMVRCFIYHHRLTT